jgi:hypothetical protein
MIRSVSSTRGCKRTQQENARALAKGPHAKKPWRQKALAPERPWRQKALGIAEKAQKD